MKKILLATLLSATLSGIVYADQWNVITEHRNLDVIWLINKDSMQCDKNICEAWIAEVNRKRERPYITALEFYEADCKKMRSRILSSAGYSGGKRVELWEGSDWERYPPGTIADSVVRTICKKLPLRTHKVFKGNILEKERDIYNYLADLAKSNK